MLRLRIGHKIRTEHLLGIEHRERRHRIKDLLKSATGLTATTAIGRNEDRMFFQLISIHIEQTPVFVEFETLRPSEADQVESVLIPAWPRIMMHIDPPPLVLPCSVDQGEKAFPI